MKFQKVTGLCFVSLFLLFLLIGCADTEIPTETALSVETPPTESISVLQDTVTFPINSSAYYDFYLMDDRALLLSTEGSRTRFTVISTKNGDTLASYAIDDPLSMDVGTVRVTNSDVTYFSRSKECLIVLDSELNVSQRIYSPLSPYGVMVPSNDYYNVYYSTPERLYHLDLTTGLSSVLSATANQSLLGSLFGGAILILSDENGDISFLDSTKGTSIHLDGDFTDFKSDQACCVQRIPTSTQSILVSGPSIPTWVFKEKADAVFPLSSCSAIATTLSESSGTKLRLWNEFDGTCIGTYQFPELINLFGIQYDESLDCFWCVLLTAANEYKLTAIPSRFFLSEETLVAYEPYYSRSSPDTLGLKVVEDSLQDTYGDLPLEIYLNNHEYLSSLPRVVVEDYYIGEQAAADIQNLNSCISLIPDSVWKIICTAKSLPDIQIILFSSITNSNELHCPGYFSLVNNTPVLFVDGSCVADSFHHALGHFLYSCLHFHIVLDWETCNPDYFQYSKEYTSIGLDEGYLSDDFRYFISPLAMTFPEEDFAEVFRFAMDPSKKDLFSGSVMIQKLDLLSSTVRSELTLPQELCVPWEQFK